MIRFIIWLFRASIMGWAIFSFAPAAAQDEVNLNGKVMDSAGQHLSSATIEVKTMHGSFFGMTNRNGQFSVKVTRIRSCQVLVTMEGCDSIFKTIVVPNNSFTIQLGILILKTKYKKLDPAIIERQVPVKQSGDTLSFAAKAFPVRAGASVEDLLSRLPGIEVDVNGNVFIQGQQVLSVLVNGREFYGGDVLFAIRSLPADIVGKLQVIDDYGDKARLTGIRIGEPGKVLNIVMRPQKSNGLVGETTLAAGASGRYVGEGTATILKNDEQLSGRANSANNSPSGYDPVQNYGFSYGTKWSPKLDGDFTMNYANQHPKSQSSYLQSTVYPEGSLVQNQEFNNNSQVTNEGFNGRLSFQPNRYTLFRINNAEGFQQSSNVATGLFNMLQTDSGSMKQSLGNSLNNNNQGNKFVNNDLYFERTWLSSRTRFSTDLAQNYIQSSAFNNTISQALVISDGDSSHSFEQYIGSTGRQEWHLTLNSIYFMPLWASSFVEIGYRSQADISKMGTLVQSPDSMSVNPVTIDSLSGTMNLNDFMQTLHLGYTFKLGHLEGAASPDLQRYTEAGNVDLKNGELSKSYMAFIPTLQVTWRPNTSHRISLDYRGSPGFPSLQQLSAIPILNSPQVITTGNPDLQPFYTNSLSIRFQQSPLPTKKTASFNLRVLAAMTRREITPSVIFPIDTGQVIEKSTFLNTGASHSLSSDYQIGFPAAIKKTISINLGGGMGFTTDSRTVNNVTSPLSTFVWSQGVSARMVLLESFQGSFSGVYSNTHTQYTRSAIGGSGDTTIRILAINLSGRHFIAKHWTVSYQFSQPYSGGSRRLYTQPGDLQASLKRDFLAGNKATFFVSGYNLLNESTAFTQSGSSPTVVESRQFISGRYFVCGFQIKLERFRSAEK